MSLAGLRALAGVLLGAAAAIVLAADARAEAPPGRYSITPNGSIPGGTVLDTMTKLTWQRTVPTETYDFVGATYYCAGLGSRWRLPSAKELATLLDLGRTKPAIDGTAFPNTPSSHYWSSTLYVLGPATYAWYVQFDEPTVSFGEKKDKYNVRCVR